MSKDMHHQIRVFSKFSQFLLMIISILMARYPPYFGRGLTPGHLLAQSSKGGAQGMKATQEMLRVRKDTGDGFHIGIPAVGDDDFGGIPERFEL